MVDNTKPVNGTTKPTIINNETAVFDPNSPQFRLKSISKHLQDLINIYKSDKSPFNRADLNDRTAHAKSLIKEANAKGADVSTIALIEKLINQSTVLLKSNEIAFGRSASVPQIPYIPQVKLAPLLFPKSGIGVVDAFLTLPNGVSIAGTALTGGAINGLASIPNAGSGLINGIIKIPAKIYDTVKLVQPRTGDTSLGSFINNPGKHYVYNRMNEVVQIRKNNKQQKAEAEIQKKKKGDIPFYTESLFGWIGNTGAQLYVGAKLFGNAPKSAAKPKGLPGTPSAKSNATSGSQTPPSGGSQKASGSSGKNSSKKNAAPGNGGNQAPGGSNKASGKGANQATGGSEKANGANKKNGAQQPPQIIDIKLQDSLQKLGFKHNPNVKHTVGEINAAYKKLQRELHPDLNPTNAQANKARLVEVNNAYDYLKVKYDIKTLHPDAVLVPK